MIAQCVQIWMDRPLSAVIRYPTSGWRTRHALKALSQSKSQSRRHKPARYGSGSIIDVPRTVYRWCRPSIRGAFVIGVHGSLHLSRSQFHFLHNTSVRERSGIFALTESQISFEDRHPAFHSLDALRSTWDAAVHFDTYRYVFI